MAHGTFPGRRSRRGYSMMEVLLGLVVVVIGLFGLLDLLTSNQKLSVRAHRRAVAVELARAKMAELQMAGYDAVGALWAKAPGGPAQPFAFPEKPAAFVAPYAAKEFAWQAQFTRNARQSEVMDVEVRVTWDLATAASAAEALGNSVSIGGMIARK